MIKQYSLKADGNKQLTPNFKVSEFRCKDGSDKILIDDTCVTHLQAIRDFFGKPVYIRSAYRTNSYNDKIGGADGSHHTTGRANDIDVGNIGDDINYRLVAMFAETLTPRPGGIGLYQYPISGDKWVHIDTGGQGNYWLATSANQPYQYLRSFLPVIKPMTGNWENMYETEIAQRALSVLGYYNGKIDGKYGKASSAAVLKFQYMYDLSMDGKLGPKTFKTLFRVIKTYQHLMQGV